MYFVVTLAEDFDFVVLLPTFWRVSTEETINRGLVVGVVLIIF